MRTIRSIGNGIYHFVMGLLLTFIVSVALFQLGRSIYSAVLLYREKDNFVEVSAEVAEIEKYKLFFQKEKKNYKITLDYPHGAQVYQYEKYLRKAPGIRLGDQVSLEIDFLHPNVIKGQLIEHIIIGIVLFLLSISFIILWCCKNKTSYVRVHTLEPERIIHYLRRKNKKENRWIIQSIMALILAGAVLMINDNAQSTYLFVAVIILMVISVWMMIGRVSKVMKLNNRDFELIYDCCAEKHEEDYGDFVMHCLVLDETEKVFSVSEKAFREVDYGDEVALLYLGRSRNKPYVMCIEKR